MTTSTQRLPIGRIWIAALLIAALAGCPDDALTADDAEGDVVSDADVSVDVTVDAAVETADHGSPDVAADPGGTDSSADAVAPDGAADGQSDVVPGPDGLLGSPCDSDSDCDVAGTDADLCFGGFCTTLCEQDGAPIAGACSSEISAVSQLGQAFTCPSDVEFCVPGNASGGQVLCSKDADCPGDGVLACAGAVLIGVNKVDGVCLPTGDRLGSGKACTEDGACASLLCLDSDPEAGLARTCAGHCKTNGDCPGDGDLCVAVGFNTEAGVEVASVWAGLCVDHESSQTYCDQASKCGAGEICEVFVEPSSLGPQYWCVPGNVGASAAGAACVEGADCLHGRCLFGGIEGATGYCASVCPDGQSDCTSGLSCESLALTARGTPDEPSDDPLYGLCVFSAETNFCFVDEQQFCADDLPCVQVVDGADNLGVCTAAP